MGFSADSILGQIKEPVVEQVAAELKKKYNKFKFLLEITDPPVQIADAPDDNGFREMAKHAIEQRELKFTQNSSGGSSEDVLVNLDEINRRVGSLPSDAKKEMGISYFDINSLIPQQGTLKKVADTVFSTTEEAEKSSLSIGFIAVIKLIVSFVGSLFGSGERISFDEAKAQTASEHIQKKLNKQFDELAHEDLAVKKFLKYKSAKDEMSVEDSIIKAIPEGVYKKFNVDAPDSVKMPEKKDLLKDTLIEEKPEIQVNETIKKVRDGVLFPEGEKPLAEQISTKILKEAGEKLAVAQTAHDSANWFEKAKTLPILKTTEELVPNEKEASDMGGKLADIVANAFEKAVKDPKFVDLPDKGAMADFIAQKVEAELADNKNLMIVKTVRDDLLRQGIAFAEFAGEKSKYAREKLELEKMPPKVGGDQYAVVTVDSARADIISGVRKGIDDVAFDNLKFASKFILSQISTSAQDEKGNQQHSSVNQNNNVAFRKARDACTVKLGSVHECSETDAVVSGTAYGSKDMAAGELPSFS